MLVYSLTAPRLATNCSAISTNAIRPHIVSLWTSHWSTTRPLDAHQEPWLPVRRVAGAFGTVSVTSGE